MPAEKNRRLSAHAAAL